MVRLKYSIYIILLIILLPLKLFPQTLSDFELIKLDTFLIRGDYDLINHFFNEKETEFANIKYNYSDSSEYNWIRNKFLNLIIYFKKLPSQKNEELDKRIQQYLKSEKKFEKEICGTKSFEYYNKFLYSNKDGKKLLALKYYILAYTYKTLFIINNRKAINEEIVEIEKYIRQKEFDKANTILENLKIEWKVFLQKEPLYSKVKYIDEKIKKELQNIRIEHEFYHQKYETNYSLMISLGAHFLPYSTSSKKDQTWQFYSIVGSYQFNYVTDEIFHNNGYGLLCDINYYLNSNFKLGLNFEKGRTNYTSVNKITDFHSEFSVKYYSFQISSDYIFRKNIGLRPFTGIGIKRVFATREKIEIKNNFISVYNVYSNEQKFNVTQFILNIGTEYVYKEDTNVVLQVISSLYYNLTDSNIVGPFGIYFGIKIGYAI